MAVVVVLEKWVILMGRAKVAMERHQALLDHPFLALVAVGVVEL